MCIFNFRNFAAVILAAISCSAETRYALILADPPAIQKAESRLSLGSVESKSYRAGIESRQRLLVTELSKRSIQVTSSISTIANAVFVVATPESIEDLKRLPGVIGAVKLRQYHQKLNRATQLINAPAAWSAVGGSPNAGAGVKIAIIDSGIDHTNPAFQDRSLAMPPGYPKCDGDACNFTNNKIIVARSYTRMLTSTDPAESRPDDYSPRDHEGHGTAAASCAAGVAVTGVAPISGVAPKAWLGNYRIFGSPGVNDTTSDDVLLKAFEDAVNDGMDVISFSVGGPAFSGPLDMGESCGNAPGVPCDLLAKTLEELARKMVVIIAAAGNEGFDGTANGPTYGTIGSPANAPSIIAAGASTNSHDFTEILTVPGANVPAALRAISVKSGDSSIPHGAITAPLRDATLTGNDGFACVAFPAGSLAGAIVLIQRGNCPFSTKDGFAEDAGAVGVVIYMADSSPTISPSGLANASIPVVVVSNADGLSLKSFVASNPERPITFDPAGVEVSAAGNTLTIFSSLGPSTGNNALKPDVLAPGSAIYMAGSGVDPLGALYSSTGFAVASGTSFSTPILAGAAALVRQKHPNYDAAQVRSALINTASQDVTRDAFGSGVDVRGVGGGKLDAAAAVNSVVTIAPPSISFGALTAAAIPQIQQLQLTNNGTSSVTLALTVAAAKAASGVSLVLNKQSVTLAAGATDVVNVTLSGAVPQPGAYTGAVTVQGSGVALRVPYLFVVGDGRVANLIPLTGTSSEGLVGEGIADGIISFRIVDNYGVAVPNITATFTAVPNTAGKLTTSTVGGFRQMDAKTDQYGIAVAEPILGPSPNTTYQFKGAAGGISSTFSAFTRVRPQISANGIVNAANFDTATPVAPGSYATIFGSNLSDFTDYAKTATLPMAINSVHVSFDVPSAGISVPGRLTFISNSQVNVQIPWELQGQSSAQVKVILGEANGVLYTLPLANYSPGVFEVGTAAAAALDASFKLIGAANPAKRGQALQIYANGLGPVSNQPATGEPASSAKLSQTTTTPVVTIGGQQAQVLFSGLAPGFPGLYQLNVIIPAGIAAGQQKLVIAIGGKTSKDSGIVVQ